MSRSEGRAMNSYIGALDQGTTSTRFIVFDRLGTIIASAQCEHRQIYPRPGWVEHDPAEIWQNSCLVIEEAMMRARLSAAQLEAIGITNQRETTVMWERESGVPLYNALVWQDMRTDRIIAGLAAEGGKERFRAATGLPLATYFSAPKIKWLLENIPAVAAAVREERALFGTIDTWLLWKLSGGRCHATDVTNASRTMLLDLASLRWDEAIASAIGIPGHILPEVLPSSGFFAEAAAPDVIAGVPLLGLIGDQQAALAGQACFQPGQAKNTYGTGCFMLLHTGARPMVSAHGLLTTVAGQRAGRPAAYALEGSVAIAGALVQWLRDNLGLISSAPEIETLARSVEDNGGLYFVPAFSGLYAPHWREEARGVIAGLTRFANRGHLARAVLEATAFQTREVLDAMIKDSGIGLAELKVDGGMVANQLLMQFQADLLDVPVVRPKVTETTALGAAYMAGLACGYWRDEEELERNWQVDQVWRPEMGEEERARLYSLWRKAVERTLNWVEPDSPAAEP